MDPRGTGRHGPPERSRATARPPTQDPARRGACGGPGWDNTSGLGRTHGELHCPGQLDRSGIRNFRDSQQRAANFAEMVREMGGTVKDFYWTIGPYDIVVVMEAPDDETVTAAALKVSGLGNVRTTTLRAFSQPEFTAIVDRAG
jgi:uncharacterized protein with GYD domain